jgi:hypothetical protein
MHGEKSAGKAARKKLLAAVFAALAAGSAGAQDTSHIQAFDMPSVRAAALGGFHAALTDDFSMAFNNPAGFAAIRDTHSISEFTTEVSTVKTLYQIYNNDITGDDLLKLASTRVDASFNLGGPFSIGKISNGVGWRFYNVTRFNFFWDRKDVFRLNPTLGEEFALSGGYGFRLFEGDGRTLDAGVSMKAFYRLIYEPRGVFIQEIKHILAEMDEKPYEAQWGGGIDLGLRWSWQDWFSAALVYKDIFSPAYVTNYRNFSRYVQQEMYDSQIMTVRPRISAGVTARLESPIMHHWDTDIVISLDYSGLYELFTRDPRSRLLYINAGFELRFLEVVSVRAGWSDWSFCGGFGFNFSVFKFDFSLGSKELGSYPGERKTLVAGIGFLFQY